MIGWRPGGRSSSTRQVEIAVQRERERSRNRRRRHEQHVGRLALGAERLALLHAEAMLLVDDGEAEVRELGRLLHERVRADDERRRRLGEPRRDLRAAPSPGRPPVTSTGSMPSGASRRVIERWCCSASSSVGAMIAA